MKNALIIISAILMCSSCLLSNTTSGQKPLDRDEKVKGWTILTDNLDEGLRVLDSAPGYDINHLQLSHDIIHDLRHVRDPRKLEIAKTLLARAHERGIKEVVVWDRSFYDLAYYPDRFRTGPGGTINMDNPEFWEWFKADYRDMLDMIPGIQGLVLTFIETGAKAENQYSEIMNTNQEKLAAVVNAVASVVIGERGMNLYARTFSHSHNEYDNIIGAIKLFKYPEIRLMMKETPHDFFLTHPNNPLPGTIPRPTIIEFDIANEFNGQGNIANTWPQYIRRRWGDFVKREHVIGYTARTDRKGDTMIIGRPTEINLYALKRIFEDITISEEQIYDEFITDRYGELALPLVKPAFKNSFDIVTSSLYTLGTNTTQHSRLNWEFRHHWALHVSGRWMENPVVRIEHGVKRDFNYWTDIVNTLAPAWAKKGVDPPVINPSIHLKLGFKYLGIEHGQSPMDVVPWVKENNWITEDEQMNEEYLQYITDEKEFGIALAYESLDYIKRAKPHLSEKDYQELFHYFNRTLLTAKLHKAVATAYFGYRIISRGAEFRNNLLNTQIRNSLQEILEVSAEVLNYPITGPDHIATCPISYQAANCWNWRSDACMAMNYYYWISEGLRSNKYYAF